MKSIFTNKDFEPTDNELKEALGETYPFWKTLADYTIKSATDSKATWNYSGDKFGWSYRISDRKRVLIYLLPREGFFKAAFVFGQKATENILNSNCQESILLQLKNARVYSEGRGIRIEIKDGQLLDDLKNLILIKIKN